MKYNGYWFCVFIGTVIGGDAAKENLVAQIFVGLLALWTMCAMIAWAYRNRAYLFTNNPKAKIVP